MENSRNVKKARKKQKRIKSNETEGKKTEIKTEN